MEKAEVKARLLRCLDEAEQDARRELSKFGDLGDLDNLGAMFLQLYESSIRRSESSMITGNLSPKDYDFCLECLQKMQAIRLLDEAIFLRSYLEKANGGDFSLACSFYNLGFVHGGLFPGELATHHSTKVAWRALLSSYDVRKSSVHNKSELYQRARKLADDRYRDGDKKWHHEMVACLMEEIEEFKSIQDGDEYRKTKRRLLKDIGNLTKEKYPDRFFLPGKSKKGKSE